jgi:RimJ/RimL family protein N-acetyltransferase
MLISPDRVLLTERCALRYPRLADAPWILQVVTDARFPRQLPLAQLTTRDAIEGAIRRRHQRWQAAITFGWCVEIRSTGHLVGMVSIGRTQQPQTWSLAYWIHPDGWRRGYATEVATEALRVAFEDLGAEVVEAGAATWNVPSQGVLEKLGFAFREESPDGYRIQGQPVRTREYALARERWSTLRAAGKGSV